MRKISEFVCKHSKFILLTAFLLLIPSIFGYLSTKINYDILTYLPSEIETLKGQEILQDEFEIGAFSTIVIENNLPAKEILKLEDEIREIEVVNRVVSASDVIGTAIPIDFLPTEVKNVIKNGDKQLMIVTFSSGTSDEATTDAVAEIRQIVEGKCLVGGMSALQLDSRKLINSEMVSYIVLAVILCLIVLEFSLDSYAVPVILLFSIGISVVFNMGTNWFLGEISYITQAISAVLQLGVTLDFSIFLYHQFEEEKEKENDLKKAMAIAIQYTAVAVIGSSTTTFAGFLALCTMSLTLGTNLGLVMAKGVFFGLVMAILVFPAILLCCDKIITKTRHKVILPSFSGLGKLFFKLRLPILIIFLVLVIPMYVIKSKTESYYNLTSSIPETFDSKVAEKELRDEFGMVSQIMVLVRNETSNATLSQMSGEIEGLDGVKSVISRALLGNYGISEEILSEDLRGLLRSENYSLMLISSDYGIATDELNQQIDNINDVIDKYDEGAIVAGEGALMKDLVTVANNDFNSVNIVSVVVIFVLMLFVLKSVSLPVILVGAIEFAIFINMGIPYLMGEKIPFISSIVIGTIQLGATIDYAILITSKYLDARKEGIEKKKAVSDALSSSIQSIFMSAMCFFAATMGVAFISRMDMINSICLMIGRGALISMGVVVTVIPTLLYFCDKIILKTTLGVRKEKNEKN